MDSPMLKKSLVFIFLAVTVSACTDSSKQDGFVKDIQGVFQHVLKRTLALFDSQSDQNSKQHNENRPVQAEQNREMLPVIPNQLTQMMANRLSIPQTTDKIASKQELEQLRQDYVQAVEVGDKVYALIALVQADQKHAIPLLKEAYASQEPELRKGAVLQMKNFNDKKEVVDLLLKALDDPNPDVVIEAVEGLARNKNKRAVKGLKKVANSHPDKIIREVAQDYVNQVEIDNQ
jgi:HEAT repeat protein